ncbi:MAG: methylmalonyl-CoA epimerase [Anaerolineales bacterium]|nr:methylmalonyl-CoA epimerase [Anaerolineae bacterium]PWB50145.1 MAG: methylmalonyl-CoA epimerase [Anaerolineales bacterium]
MTEIKHIHHIAVLVGDIEASLGTWQAILGIEPTQVRDIPQEAVKIAFFPVGDSEIELVQPTTPDSGLSRYLEKHGPAMHHLCLEVADLPGLLQKLASRDIQLINDQPKVGEDGKLYAFIHPKSTNGVLIELYQLPK